MQWFYVERLRRPDVDFLQISRKCIRIRKNVNNGGKLVFCSQNWSDLSFCEKRFSSEREKLLKIKADGREFVKKKTPDSRIIYSNSEMSF